MTNLLLDLSGKLPPDIEAVLQDVAQLLSTQGSAFFIVGALARDLVLEHAWNLPPQRATNDIDFGVRVADWSEFARLKAALLQTTQYTEHPHQQQRLLHTTGVIVDVVPFGGIEAPLGRIVWPRDEAITMTTLGFQEAYAQAIRVVIGGDTEIAVCSPAGLALLKLLAWNERRERKDAGDLGAVLYYYLEAGNEERLYKEHADLLDLEFKRAGARMLGRDLSTLLTEQSRPVIEAVLQRETAPDSRYHLVSVLVGSCWFLADDVARGLVLLEDMLEGIRAVRVTSQPEHQAKRECR
jgi:predicted nucleotidyltransferase